MTFSRSSRLLLTIVALMMILTTTNATKGVDT